MYSRKMMTIDFYYFKNTKAPFTQLGNKQFFSPKKYISAQLRYKNLYYFFLQKYIFIN